MLPSALRPESLAMATPKGDVLPLSLQRCVSSIVHELGKVGRPLRSAPTTWPFKILIVRAGPKDLAPVPPAAPIAKKIRAHRQDLADAEQIQVHVLSTEPDGTFEGPPTREGLRSQLSRADLLGEQYHLLVFLGHGDVQEVPGRPIPTGQLQLEGAQQESDPYEARKIAGLLAEFPVPVVLLMGCMTAADLNEEQLATYNSAMPKWLRGCATASTAATRRCSWQIFLKACSSRPPTTRQFGWEISNWP
jgi:hypothetical protein